jgi:hypothetical protein
MRVAGWVAAAVTLGIVVTGSSTALGQHAESDDLFYQGKALMEEGRVADACEKFARSVTLVRRGGALLNLAVCKEAEGHYAVAFRYLVEARDIAGKDGRADRVALADAHIANTRTHLSWVTVRPAAGVATQGLSIGFDGEMLSEPSWGTPVPVDPGTHSVTATAPGRAPFEETVVVGPPGDVRAIEVFNRPAAPSTTVAQASDPAPTARNTDVANAKPAGWKNVAGWGALGAGAAAIALGSTFGIEAIVDSRASKSQCVDGFCNSGGYAKNHAAHTEADVADVAIPAGLVAVAAGLYLLLVPSSPPARQVGSTADRARSSMRAPVRSRFAVSVGKLPGAAGKVGFAVQGQW